ncbi:hypothetical protein DRN43_02985 [Thermococci archaeon]|nr:MAG: hypothetical protein DRN43_02985 [Thermococci archaeon]
MESRIQMQRMILVPIMVLIVASAMCINSHTYTYTYSTSSGLNELTEEQEKEIREMIFERINEIRRQNGIPPFKYNLTLEKAAQMHADDMARRNYFSHESPEGENFMDRLAKAGYRPRSFSDGKSETIVYGGENLFFYGGKGNVESIVTEAIKGWMNSKGHRENRLRKEFALTGIGVAFSNNCTYEDKSFTFCVYIVEMFG